ncbi:MAG: exodeoxyribonuclease VII large subunit [Opitutae bacterium]|nr:exodeoxyribonuclease VII large subunit [Opitutae bacterium]MCD8299189.1 exodeoxyribonuclease VII large subunit [Opitutae bacterium]
MLSATQQQRATESELWDTPLSVSEFTDRIKSLVNQKFPGIWIRGEISNFHVQNGSGHAYFTLKDANSQLAAVMFRPEFSRTDVALREGLQIIAFGKIDVYRQRGNYQLVVKFVQEEGLGRLQAEFNRLKKKLEAEGIFDKSQKKLIPKIARKIAFVTSPTGAAIRDFISILRRRNWTGTLYVLPAKVQGVGAKEEIVQQIKVAEKIRGLDLLVVGRGGGSLEDLWCFNEECVARAIHAAKVPIISAVGHEIDYTLSDLAADFRAETPSAAAEMISSNLMEMTDRVETAADTLDRIADNALHENGQQLDHLEARLENSSPKHLLSTWRERLLALENRLATIVVPAIAGRRERLAAINTRLQELSPRHFLSESRERLHVLENRLTTIVAPAVARKRERLSAMNTRLKMLAPDHKVELARLRVEQLAARLSASGLEATLKRGFAIATDATTNKILTSSREIGLGQDVILRFHDGTTRVQGQDLN